MLNLVGYFIAFLIVGWVVDAAIKQWDESQCPSRWRTRVSMIELHLKNNHDPWIIRRYDEYRLRRLTFLLEKHQQEIWRMTQEQPNTLPRETRPGHKESGHPY